MLRCGLVLPGLAAVLLAVPGCNEENKQFKMADTDGNGSISASEFERYMLEAIYAASDADGNAKITFAEWQAANPDADKDKFGAPDRNGDRSVTPAELKAHFARQGTMDDLFSKIDTDKSGSLSQDEVKVFKKTLEAQSGSTSMQKLSQAATQ